MENDPRRRRSRGGRRRGGLPPAGRPKPNRAPVQPKAPRGQALVPRDRPPRRRPSRGAAPRGPDDLRPGTPCVVLMDSREGEPDRSGAFAVFEGFFDLETGDPRRAGFGVPRLRIVRPAAPPPTPVTLESPSESPSAVRPAPGELPATERLWGFECWWRVDPNGAGLTESDHEALERSKKLLRGLVRDSRRAGRPVGVR